MNVDEIRKGYYQLESLMAAWWCKCMTIPKSLVQAVTLVEVLFGVISGYLIFSMLLVSQNQMM